MGKESAGLLLFRIVSEQIEVLLAHPGGPYWANKDEGAWSIPKGELNQHEDPFKAAKREFAEEMGRMPSGEVIPLEPLRQPSGKVIYAWAMNADFDPPDLKSNTFTLEWPPKSGQLQEFPEVDRVAWFSIEVASHRILKGQAPFLFQLKEKLGHARKPSK
jgi:predicted NUDIX family NTP pyrophosphohydrolase